MDSIVKARNFVIGGIYTSFVKKICFMFDAEKMHMLFADIGKILGRYKASRFLSRILFDYGNATLEQKIMGINFRNPIGLSAGFDKNAELPDIMNEIGFGFAEVGSITMEECLGNPGKRLARLPDSGSIWVNLGLNNIGAKAVHSKLKNRRFGMPIGISIAKTNCRRTADTKEGMKDFVLAVKELKDIGDYITLNVSCPNTFGGLPFHKPALYEKLIKKISKLKVKKPIFVKLSPDIKRRDIDRIISISRRFGISGFICSNLTKENEKKSGGFSGKLVEKKANSLLEYIYKKTRGKFVLIGSGGIFSAEDAYKKIRLGASLVQIFTGMIYKGPSLMSDVNIGLAKLLKADGYTNISQAIGKGIKNE